MKTNTIELNSNPDQFPHKHSVTNTMLHSGDAADKITSSEDFTPNVLLMHDTYTRLCITLECYVNGMKEHSLLTV